MALDSGSLLSKISNNFFFNDPLHSLMEEGWINKLGWYKRNIRGICLSMTQEEGNYYLFTLVGWQRFQPLWLVGTALELAGSKKVGLYGVLSKTGQQLSQPWEFEYEIPFLDQQGALFLQVDQVAWTWISKPWSWDSPISYHNRWVARNLWDHTNSRVQGQLNNNVCVCVCQ